MSVTNDDLLTISKFSDTNSVTEMAEIEYTIPNSFVARKSQSLGFYLSGFILIISLVISVLCFFDYIEESASVPILISIISIIPCAAIWLSNVENKNLKKA